MDVHPGKLLTTLLALGSVLASVGCKSLPHCAEKPTALAKRTDPDLKSKHVIELSAEGFLYDLRHGRKHRLITNAIAAQEYLNLTVFDGLKRSGQTNVLMFIHGGLTSRETGLAHFTNSWDDILAAGSYPLFVVWPTGPWGTYTEHLLSVRQGIRPDTSGQWAFSTASVPFVLLGDFGRAVTRLPLVMAHSARSDWETVRPARSPEGGAAVLQYQDMVDSHYQVLIGDDYSRTSDRMLRSSTYWLTLPTKWFTASLLDGMGKGAWDMMLRRTQEVYPERPDSDIMTNAFNPTITIAKQNAVARKRELMNRKQQMRAERHAASGLPAFLELLARWQTNRTGHVTLVGHSMGCIILNRVLRDTTIEIDNLVYMGAACSIDDFSATALPYLRKHPRTQFYNLCLHPVAEAGEWQAGLGDITPRGSLLVWIDNFFSNPVHERERTFGRWRNLFRSNTTGEPIVRQFYENDPTGTLKQRLHFRAFSVGFGDETQQRGKQHQWNRASGQSPVDVNARCNHPLSHGEFSEMPFWRNEFWWPANPAVR